MFDNKVCVGEARLALAKIPKEALVDSWIPLKPSSQKGAPQQVYGQVHVRYLFSAITETRPIKPEQQIKMEYFYTKNNTVFKAGDLIAYSGNNQRKSLDFFFFFFTFFRNGSFGHLQQVDQ